MLMPVNVVQWHVEIGVDVIRYATKFSCSSHAPSKNISYCSYFYFVAIVYVGGYRVKSRTY